MDYSHLNEVGVCHEQVVESGQNVVGGDDLRFVICRGQKQPRGAAQQRGQMADATALGVEQRGRTTAGQAIDRETEPGGATLKLGIE